MGISFYTHTTYRVRVNPGKFDFNTLKICGFKNFWTPVDVTGPYSFKQKSPRRTQFQPRLRLNG